MDQADVEAFLEENGGVISISEAAAFFGVDEGDVRRWAREHDVRRLGSVFALDLVKVIELGVDLEAITEDEEEDGEEEDQDGDQGEDDEDDDAEE